MAYEMSLSIKHISTSSKSRNALNIADAVGKSKANISYITRDSAAADEDTFHATADGVVSGDREKLEDTKLAIERRAEKDRKGVGIRLTDKLMVSLPADATHEEHREMSANLLGHLVQDSEASALGAIHRDRKGNPHLHILYVDGLETQTAAKARRPEAKRVRRQDHGRLNDGGRPKELRAEFAEIINEVGQRNGRNFAEHRSFKERGIVATPQIHEGVQVRDKMERRAEAMKKDQQATGANPSKLKLTEQLQARLVRNMQIVARRVANDNREKTALTHYNRLPKRFKTAGPYQRNWHKWADDVTANSNTQTRPSKTGGEVKRKAKTSITEIRKLSAKSVSNTVATANRLTQVQSGGGADDGLDDVMKLARKLKISNLPKVPNWAINFRQEKTTKTARQNEN